MTGFTKQHKIQDMTICNKDQNKSKKGHNVEIHNIIKNATKNLKKKSSIGPSATFKHLT